VTKQWSLRKTIEGYSVKIKYYSCSVKASCAIRNFCFFIHHLTIKFCAEDIVLMRFMLSEDTSHLQTYTIVCLATDPAAQLNIQIKSQTEKNYDYCFWLITHCDQNYIKKINTFVNELRNVSAEVIKNTLSRYIASCLIRDKEKERYT